MKVPSKNLQIAKAEKGFTLVEMLVSLLILSVIMAAIFSFLWGASRYWQTGQAAADVTENARLGLNRMTREIKQASLVTQATPTQLSFVVNFGGGEETVTYSFTPGTAGSPGYVWRSSSTSPGQQATLMDSVEWLTFHYFGNDYRCDQDGNGIITFEELSGCTTAPEAKISHVDIELTMRSGDEVSQPFVGQAWLRNRSVVEGA